MAEYAHALTCPSTLASPTCADIPCAPPPPCSSEPPSVNSRFLQLVDELVKEHDRVISCFAESQVTTPEPKEPPGIAVSKSQGEGDVHGEAAEAEDALRGSKSFVSHASQAGLQLWPCWEASDVGAGGGGTWVVVDLGSPPGWDKQHSWLYGATTRDLGTQSWFINPSSRRRAAWDVVGFVLLIYDLFRIPLLAFDPPQLQFLAVVDWISLAYWTLDIPVSCVTGFHSGDGTLVTDIRKIGWHYFKTWFGLDLLVVVPDWMTSLMEVSNAARDQDRHLQAIGVLRIGKVARLGRILRFLRLARLAKLNTFIYMIQERVSTESTAIAVGVMKNMLLLLALNHVFACMWFWIGNAEVPVHEKSWVAVYHMKDAGLGEQYLLSLHWTLTQFTPAGMNVQPQNDRERTFNVILIVIAMISFSTFVSSITSSMTRLRMIHEDDVTANFQLRKYLNQNTISGSLCFRILRFIDFAKGMHRRKLNPSRVELLQLLSGPLRLELHYEIYSPTLSMHAFFIEYGHCDRTALSELCFKGTSAVALSKMDHLFSCGARAHAMYFITSGTLAYKQAKRQDVFRPRINLSVGKWICETVLWMPWVHRGTMSTVIECEVVTLDGAKFREVTAARTDAFMRCKDYAIEFLSGMIQTQETYGGCWDVPVHMMLQKGSAFQRRLLSTEDLADFEGDVTIAEEFEAELLQSTAPTQKAQSSTSTLKSSPLSYWQTS